MEATASLLYIYIINSPNKAEGKELEISLRNQGNHSGPIDDTRIPHSDHITFPIMEDDERERVNKSQSEHGPSDPVMEHDQSFVRDTSQGCDHIGLRW